MNEQITLKGVEVWAYIVEQESGRFALTSPGTVFVMFRIACPLLILALPNQPSYAGDARP